MNSILPHSAEAEAGVLGTILMDERAYDHVAGFLEAHHFASALNSRIYSVIVSLIEQGQTVNPVTVHPYLAADDLLDAAGGMKYLTGLAVGLLNEHYNQTTESLLRSFAERGLETTSGSAIGPKTRLQK